MRRVMFCPVRVPVLPGHGMHVINLAGLDIYSYLPQRLVHPGAQSQSVTRMHRCHHAIRPFSMAKISSWRLYIYYGKTHRVLQNSTHLFDHNMQEKVLKGAYYVWALGVLGT